MGEQDTGPEHTTERHHERSAGAGQGTEDR
jgi:hypothetical protein